MTTAAPERANGHARPVTLAPLPARGPVSGWPQQGGAERPRTDANEPERVLPAAVRLRAAWDARRQKVLYGIAAAVLLSTAASFYESFTGLMGWFTRLGFHGLRAVAAPAMVDLVGLTGEAIALVVIIEGRPGKMVRVLAWFAFSWGLVLSVVGNAGRDGFRPGVAGWFDMAWFAVPPLSLAIITSAALALAKLLLKPATDDAAGVQPHVRPHADKPVVVAVDKQADKQADKPPPRKSVPARTAVDKAAAAIRDNPGLAEAKAWTALAGIAGVSAKTVKRAMDGTAKTPLA